MEPKIVKSNNIMEDSIITRIEELKTLLGFTSDGKFADFVHLSRSNYSRMMSGGRTIGGGVINKVCLYTKCSREWLTIGEGEMFPPGASNTNQEKDVTKRDTPADVSILIGLMDKQQKRIEELQEELVHKNSVIDELRDKFNQKHS